jgi:hypothetical protein
MGTDEIRNELEEELTSYLDKVDKLPLHPKNKLLADYQQICVQ